MLDWSTAPPTNSKLLARLALPGASAAEGAEVDQPESSALTVDVRTRIEAAEKALKTRAQAEPDVAVEEVEQLLREAEAGLTKVENDGAAADLTVSELWAVEAVVEADGSRPVLFVQDGAIDLHSPEINDGLGRFWAGPASDFYNQIGQVVRSVGGVQLPRFENKRIGTAFAIGSGLVLTNRHVLEEIAFLQDGTWTWRFEAEVDFAGEYQRDHENKFKLDQVVFTGPNPINRRVDFDNLDLAVIKVRDQGKEFPKPLTFEASSERSRVSESSKPAIYVVGFPAKPWIEVDEILDRAPRAGHEYRTVLEKLFKDRFGSKRWSPGTIDAGPGQVAGDPHNWIMTHNASTLGGNSGSCVVDFRDNGCKVVGLHFGGRPRIENYAHSVATLQGQLEIAEGPIWA